MSDPVLSVEELTIGLPEGADRAHAVEDVSLALAKGEILCVVGESGSGKSMTANALMGLLPPGVTVRTGRAMFEGRDILSLPEPQKQAMRGERIAMIFQEPMTALNPLMRIGEQIAEVYAAHDRYSTSERKKRALDLIREVGLPDPEKIIRAYPFQLSGGQRQRAMIAMALALEPTILIADEPTTALDVTTQAQILTLIRDIQRRKGMSVMFITHDFGVVAEIADSVVVMEKGHVVEEGPADRVLRAPRHEYTQRLIAAVPHLRGDDRPKPAGAEEPPVLEVRNLVKTYASGSALLRTRRVVPAVQDVSFRLARGSTLGIVGESGSGKSSLGRLLVRLMEADSGQILFEGEDIAPLPEPKFRSFRQKIQMIFQDPFASLNPRMTVGTILTVGPMAYGVKASDARARMRCCSSWDWIGGPSGAIRTNFRAGSASASASPAR